MNLSKGVKAPNLCRAPSTVAVAALLLATLPVAALSQAAQNVKAWGWGWYGQLGNGADASDGQDFPPAAVTGLNSVKAVEAGTLFSLALKTNGTVWGWGHNRRGQLGNGTFYDSAVPVAVSGLTGVVAISAGGLPHGDDHLEVVAVAHSLALKSNGTVWAWGSNDEGQLGNGSYASSNVPVQVSNLTGVVAIAAGGYHSLALKSDGRI